MKTFLAVVTVLFAVSFYFFCIPLPQAIEEPWKLRSLNFFIIVFKPVAEIGSLLGIGSSINISRRLSNIMEKRIQHYEDPEVKVMWSNFVGIPVLIHEPIETSDEPKPAIVYFHGGGFVFSDPNQYLKNTVPLAKDLNAMVFSVNYRKAPEHPFPAGFEDCVAITSYVMKNALKFNIDPNRIAVAGDSAGGNLAAAVSLKLRLSVDLPPIKAQVLIYPVLQALNYMLPSYLQNDKVPILSRTQHAFFTLKYANEEENLIPVLLANNHTSSSVKNSDFAMYVNPQNLPKKYLKNYVQQEANFGDFEISQRLEYKLLDPFMFPLMERNLNNLPPALIVTCEFDILRDDGILYSQRLKSAGIPVIHEDMEGGFHGAWSLKGLMNISDRMHEIVVNYLKIHL